MRSCLLMVAFALLAAGCGGPMLVFPGGALRGEVVPTPVDDWSFADDRFIDPAEGRRWLDHIRADPRVRVRLGGKVYPATAVLVGKPGELEGFDADRFVYRIDSRTE